eukprot:6175555-Amphidinium_carterae.1
MARESVSGKKTPHAPNTIPPQLKTLLILCWALAKGLLWHGEPFMYQCQPELIGVFLAERPSSLIPAASDDIG